VRDGGIGWRNAVLWEQLCGPRNTVTFRLRDVVQVAAIVVLRRSEEPRVEAMRGP
jgi:CII-binding regulator of phage lambda lysogenization HflD